jgi:galactokinase
MTAAADLFASTFDSGRSISRFSAPGRVNLIGEHTDYNNGLVLPFAIDARTDVAVARNDDGVVRVVSAQRPESVRALEVRDIEPGGEMDWSSYPFGVFWALTEAGYQLGGVDIAISSNVPVGAGLSSSAALECAVTLGLASVFGHDVPLEDIARLAQRAENDYVGIPCGLMDQMASSVCRAGHVLFFDVGAGTMENIPFDPAAAGLTVLIIDTKAHHSLADGEYAKRRASCERAASILGVSSLSDIPFESLDETLARLNDDELVRRVRHIITENERVRRVVAQLRTADPAEIGPDLTASHVSLRDDYEVSAAELDVAVDAALEAGALGARMTGGGFGGSVVALVAADAADAIGEAVTAAFERKNLKAPSLYTVNPAEGARVDG